MKIEILAPDKIAITLSDGTVLQVADTDNGGLQILHPEGRKLKIIDRQKLSFGSVILKVED